MNWSYLQQMLIKREMHQQPIRVGIAGAGFLGRGLINQLTMMKGIKITAVANRNLEKTALILERNNLSFKFCSTLKDLIQVMDEGRMGITSNPLCLPFTHLNIIIDCTGDPKLGALLALLSIENNKHFIAAPEMDATIGPLLQEKAKKKGVVYSGAFGDEPGVIMDLYSFVCLLGLRVLAAGKFKGYYNPSANPNTVKPWAEEYDQNPFMIASFADGSKMNIEMTLLSNATGLFPDVRGMHCPPSSLSEVTTVLTTKENGGILHSTGVVEVVLDVKPEGGVFVIATTDHPQLKKDLEYLKMGPGPNYLFYRPYHLCGVEMGLSIIQAALFHKATIAPKGSPVSQVIAIAKRDLEAKEELDPIGGYTYYGLMDHSALIYDKELLPLALAEGSQIIKPIKKGEPIPLHAVKIEEDSILYKLWLQQRYYFSPSRI